MPHGKSDRAYRTIGEASEELDVPAHVLRFWETKFHQIKPMKRAGGRRFYRPQDIALISEIKRLLYDDGLTIKGVQKLLRENGASSLYDAAPAAQAAGAGAPSRAGTAHLHAALEQLNDAKARLDAALSRRR